MHVDPDRKLGVTFETLKSDDFLEAIKGTILYVDWAKAHSEFRAANANAK